MSLYPLLRRTPLLAILLIASVAAAMGLTPPAASKASSMSQMQMPIAAALFVEDGDFTSTLILVNGSSLSTYADVTLRRLDGTTAATIRVQFALHSQQQVKIGALLASAGAAGTTSGSITVMQSPALIGPVIVAALSITQQSSPTPHYIDQELAMPTATDSQVLRGVADRSDGSPLVAITSLSDMPQHIAIACLDGGQGESSKVTLAPGQTVLRPACDAAPNANADLHWYAENLPNTPRRAVGIAPTSDGMPGSFAAFGLAPHDSSHDRYFSSVPFTDPKMLNSSTAVFAGVPVGSSPLLPQGTYVPVLALANFSQTPRHVTVSYPLTQSGAPSLKTITTVTLAPFSSREIALRGLTGDPMLQDSFLVESDGSPGDVGTKLVSRSKDSRLHEVELLAKDLDDTANGGDHPWTMENGATSTLLLFNESSKPQWFNVRIAAGALVWSKAYQLQPKQTIAININDLSRTRAKDDNGKAFPSDIWWGQVGWSVPQKDAGRGRLLQSNPEAAMARSFNCDWILMICGADLNLENDAVPIGQTISYGEVDDIQLCMNSCSGELVGGGEQDAYTYGWSSENYDVASVYESPAAWDLFVNGVGSGGAYIDGWISDGYCTVYVQGPIAVTPTITSISPSTVPIGGNGVQVTISGAGFGTSPSLNLPSGVTASNQQSSDAQITVTLAAAYSATIGKANLSVTANGQPSNTVQVILNGPAYAQVISDNIGQNLEGTVVRLTTYQVHNFDGTTTTVIPVAENFTTSGWSYQNAPQPPTETTACDGSMSTNTGEFTDE